MRGTDWNLEGSRNWFKIGFHSYRHSFASNLAAAGVDQRIIDEFMGHQTEAMRKTVSAFVSEEPAVGNREFLARAPKRGK